MTEPRKRVRKQPPQGPYKPLRGRQIRVLCLAPGLAGESLSGRFRIATVADIPNPRARKSNKDLGIPRRRYDAISYAWGSSEKPHRISIGGHQLPITESLHGALHQFRDPAKVRRLWADAVCINQEDNQEKSLQVAMMARIYRQAAHVRIWVGPSEKSDALAFAAAKLLAGSTFNILDDEDLYEEVSEALEQISHCHCCHEDFGDDQRGSTGIGRFEQTGLSFHKLVSRRWFSRLWIVQEILCRPDHLKGVLIHCGLHQLLLQELYHAILRLGFSLLSEGFETATTWLPEVYRRLSEDIDVVKTLWHDFEGVGAPTASEVWLKIAGTHRQLCSDNRDRIFAMRTVLFLEHIEKLTPDYAASDLALFKCFAYETMRQSNFPHEDPAHCEPWIPLTIAGTEMGGRPSSERTREQCTANFPSWAFHLHQLGERSYVKIVNNTADWPRQFLPDSKYFNVANASNNLRLRGACFAVIDQVIPATSWPMGMQTGVDTLTAGDVAKISSWYIMCMSVFEMLDERLIETLDTLDVFHEFLTCGWGVGWRHYQVDLKPLPSELVPMIMANWNHQELGTGEPEALMDELDKLFRLFIVKYAFNHPRFDKCRMLCSIVSKDGLDIGWVPTTVEPGDKMCIVGGTPWPLVVRKKDDSTYSLLGDAFTARGTLQGALSAGNSGERGAGETWSSPRRDAFPWYMRWDAGFADTSPRAIEEAYETAYGPGNDGHTPKSDDPDAESTEQSNFWIFDMRPRESDSPDSSDEPDASNEAPSESRSVLRDRLRMLDCIEKMGTITLS
jgi:hypothetical protein